MPNGDSFYTVRLNDPRAVCLEPGAFGAVGDGTADDTEAVQAAVNAAQEATGFGLVFVMAGRYRLSRTVHVWAGIRLIGFGERRPAFVLGEVTPGFQEGEGRYLLHFVSGRPPEGQPVRDANPGTFYSALSNIDIEIGEGNGAAIGVRAHWAQHCYVAHVDFRIGSGRAGIEEVGNEIDDCRFFGGDYGIVTTKPSPSWPFLMIDTAFEGQRSAAIRTEEGGMTLVRNRFTRVPTAVSVNPDRAEELFIIDSRFEEVSGPALVISDEDNARMQVNVLNSVCREVPVLAAFRQSGLEIQGSGDLYRVVSFCHGLQIHDLGAAPEHQTAYSVKRLAELPPPVPSDVPALPPCESWVNVHTLGAVGDGVTDDTAALQAAIAQHRALYLPTGRYIVTDTLTLQPDTVLIGLSPIATQLVVPDDTPAFQGAVAEREPPEAPPWLAQMLAARRKPGEPAPRLPRWLSGPPPAIEGPPKALLEAPKGGTNIVTGLGLDPGGTNVCAVAAVWRAGADSMMNDVRFMGGHGMFAADGSRISPYNENRTADGNPDHVWDSQYWSLWVTDGGGGTFKDIWTPSPTAHAGICVSDTETQGRIYAMSVEHHVRNEVIFRNVANWRIFALQLEEESGEGTRALPVELDRCRDLMFANLYLYRVIRMVTSFPYGVRMAGCRDIAFHGVHVYSPTKFSFDAGIYDATHDVEVRSREIARLTVSGRGPVQRPLSISSVVAPGAEVEWVAEGFDFIDGATVDAAGNVAFTDGHLQRIYRWSVESDEVELVSDLPLAPIGLAYDRSGRLLVVTRTGTVLSLDPEGGPEDLRIVRAEPAVERPGAVAVLPGHRWRDGHDVLAVSQARPEQHFVSPDGSIFIPKSEDLVRAFSLRPAVVGETFYLADEFGQKTWAFDVGADGSLSDARLFAEEGELDVAVDALGNVYVAAGQIFVYDPEGEPIDVIEVPERPACLVFGGADGRTLFITARSSLYRVQMRFPGRAVWAA